MSDPLVQELRELASVIAETPDTWPLLRRAADALDAAHQREAALSEALRNLVTKLDAAFAHPSYTGAMTLAYAHGHNYSGPSAEAEMNAAKALLGRADRDPAVPGLKT